MTDATPPSDDLPPRHAWEEPRAEGWSSSLPDLGKELGLFAVSAAMLFGAVKVVHEARKLGATEQHGFAFAIARRQPFEIHRRQRSRVDRAFPLA